MNKKEGRKSLHIKAFSFICLAVLFSTNFWGANVFSFLDEKSLSTLRITSGFFGFTSLLSYFILKKKEEDKRA